MIDRKARNQLIDAIYGLVSARMDNLDFDNLVGRIRTNDMGVIKIREAMWQVYDDLQRHTLTGRWALSDAQKKTVERFILFLRADSEYPWQPRPLNNAWVRLLVGGLSLGFIARYLHKKWQGCGDWEVWPFKTVGQFNEAARHRLPR